MVTTIGSVIIPIISHSYNLCVGVGGWVRTFNICSLSNFQMYSTVWSLYCILCPRKHLPYNQKFVPFDKHGSNSSTYVLDKLPLYSEEL